MDIRLESARELIREHETQKRRSREGGLLWAAIFFSMSLIVSLLIVSPTYRRLHDAIALPLFIDQMTIMAVIAYAIHYVSLKLWTFKSRFPELNEPAPAKSPR